LILGVHRNAYTLTNVVNNADDWRHDETTLAQRYRGETEVLALYVQDAWQLRDDLKLTLGWRGERFRTFDGEQLARVASCAAEAERPARPTATARSTRSSATPAAA
jgi:outer membrane receptor protein involved in Fe transport